MSSLIEGYNYDIFISYRQKDNKHDGWVTEFVNNLKGELESTFKEEISVYFDINPHDGLLETHDVDASLKEKLKCLIFIPIISRTYCDPKSFAWEHEFKAFVDLASQDEFGLKVKLPNGNVAGRVLSVQIHDIDKDDIDECESVLNGALRGIEFIYKEPGVNRPLSIKDSEEKNLNHTNYRNQINKVALAIKEISGGISGKIVEPAVKSNVSVITKSAAPDKSIIVLPFQNLSPDRDQEYFSDGLTEEIITDLSYIHDLLVISRSSAMTFKGSKKTIPEIAREVNVRYALEGSVRKSGNNLRIVAQLIDARSDSHVWAEKFSGTLDDIFDIQEKVSRSISKALKLKLTGEEKVKLSEVKISDITSYEFYIKAKKYMFSWSEEGLDLGMKLTNEALSISADNALLYSTRSMIFWQYINTGVSHSPELLEKADHDADKAIGLDPSCSLGYYAKGLVALKRGQIEASVLNLEKAASLENGGESLYWLGYLYSTAGQMDLARQFAERAFSVDPLNDIGCELRGIIEIYGGNFVAAVSFLKKALEINPTPIHYLFLAIAQNYAGDQGGSISSFKVFGKVPGMPDSMFNMWVTATNGDENEFLRYSIQVKEYGIHNPVISWLTADCFSLMGNTDQALFWIENAINEGFFNHIFFFEIDPNLNAVRQHPRFNTLMEKAKIREENFKKALGY